MGGTGAFHATHNSHSPLAGGGHAPHPHGRVEWRQAEKAQGRGQQHPALGAPRSLRSLPTLKRRATAERWRSAASTLFAASPTPPPPPPLACLPAPAAPRPRASQRASHRAPPPPAPASAPDYNQELDLVPMHDAYTSEQHPASNGPDIAKMGVLALGLFPNLPLTYLRRALRYQEVAKGQVLPNSTAAPSLGLQSDRHQVREQHRQYA